jgi:hypothetical protein
VCAAFTIDPVMRDLVEQNAVDIIASKPGKSRTPREDVRDQDDGNEHCLTSSHMSKTVTEGHGR